MALTKAQIMEILSAAGVDGEHMGSAVEKIINGYTASVNALREEADAYKAEASKLPDIQKQLEQAQAEVETFRKDSWKVKYEAVKEDFENFKMEQAKKETRAAKEMAYRNLLKAAGIAEKRIDAVLRVSDVDGVELDGKGGIKDAEKLSKSVREEWSDFIVSTETRGAETANPPADNGGTTMTKDEIFKIKDAGERQKAIAENIELFQKG